MGYTYNGLGLVFYFSSSVGREVAVTKKKKKQFASQIEIVSPARQSNNFRDSISRCKEKKYAHTHIYNTRNSLEWQLCTRLGIRKDTQTYTKQTAAYKYYLLLAIRSTVTIYH